MRLKPRLIAAAVLAGWAAVAAAGQPSEPPLQTGEPARPSDSTANRPSESGAQTNLPAGAATGAGQPQGRAQPADAQAPDSAKSKSQTKSGAQAPSGKRTKQARADKKRSHRAIKRKPATVSNEGSAASGQTAR